MLMVLLYFIAVMLETGVGVWIFGKMFPKRKEYSKYRIAEKIVLLLSNMLMYTALKGWFKISINIKVIIGVCLLLIVYDIFEKQLNFLNLDCAAYIKIKKYFLFICMLFFLTVQYKGSYLSVTGAISGNTVVPFFLFAFYNCRFIQSYLWEVAYLLNLGLLKILYIFAIGTFNGQTLENGLYNITSQTDPYSGVIWIMVISILAVILQKTIDIGTWMKKLLNKHLFIVGSICFIEGGVSYFLFIFFNATITDKDWIYAFFVVTGLMLILLLISVSGIGGNTARMILSALSPSELVSVISAENANLLKTVKGIGLKTAQRLIVELKDKIKTVGMAAVGGTTSAGMLLQSANAEVQEEAVAALTMLGFAAAPSQKVVLAVLKEEPEAPVEKVIKLALKRL